MRLTTKITTSQLEAAFAFVITTIFIFITNDTLFFGTNSAAIFSQIKYLLFYGVLVYLVIKNLQPRVIRAKRDDLYILLIMIFIILLCASFYGDFRGGYIQKIWVIVGSFLLCNLYSIDVITGIYNKAMSFLVWVSLIYELIYMFFPQLLSIYTVTNTGGVEFYSCIFSNMPVESGGVIRNFGFAREPGVYAIYIVLALLFETFSTGNKRTNRIVIYIIGILTTLSTTGYIALASYLVTLFCYLNLFRFKRKKRFWFLLFLAIFLILYLAFGTDILFGSQYGSIFGKMSGDSDYGESYDSRYASIVTNIKMGLSNPIFGKGLTFVDNNFTPITKDLLNVTIKDNANTLLIHFAQFGIFFFLLQFYGLYKSMKSMCKQPLIIFLCLFTYVLVCMGQTMAASPIFFILLFLRER